MNKLDEIKKIKKRKQMRKVLDKLKREEKQFTLTDKQISSNIVSDLESRLNEYQAKLKEVACSPLDDMEKNKKKKYIKEKIRKLKKNINSEDNIKYMTKMKKQSIRKLKGVLKKLQEVKKKENVKKLVCFVCRQKGHTSAECKEQKNSKICFNCGSTDHSVHTCPKDVDYSNMPFASCFICGEKGHLSSKCEKSDKGIYVHGGNCHICKSNQHLAKNCPEKSIKQQSGLRERKNYNNKQQ